MENAFRLEVIRGNTAKNAFFTFFAVQSKKNVFRANHFGIVVLTLKDITIEKGEKIKPNKNIGHPNIQHIKRK